MNHRQQIIKFARNTAGMVRIALRSQRPDALMRSVTHRLSMLCDYGCHAMDATAQDKETARRCVTAINAMFRMDEMS